MNITHETDHLDDLLLEDFNKKDDELNKYYKGFSYVKANLTCCTATGFDSITIKKHTLIGDFKDMVKELREIFNKPNKFYYSSDLSWYQKLWDWWCKLWQR